MAHDRSGIALGFFITLAACGGGGGGGETPVVTPPPSVNPVTTPIVSGLSATRDTLLATYSDPTVYTALSSLPTSGTATYNGTFSGQLANRTDSVTDTLIGAMTLNVGFTASSVQVSGTVSDVIDDDNDALSGRLDLSGGSLDRAGNPSSDATLLLMARGTLTDSDGRALEIGAQLEGDFLGTGHRAVGGEVLGNVRVNGADQDFDGGFIGAR